MDTARVETKGEAHWVETCFCDPPLAEERPDWEGYFDLLSVKDGMRVAIAVMKTGPSRGHVAIAIARNGWKKNWPEPANPFYRSWALPLNPNLRRQKTKTQRKRKVGCERIYIS